MTVKQCSGMSNHQILLGSKPMFPVMSMGASSVQIIKICPLWDFAGRWFGGTSQTSRFLAGGFFIHDSFSQFLHSYFDAIQNGATYVKNSGGYMQDAPLEKAYREERNKKKFGWHRRQTRSPCGSKNRGSDEPRVGEKSAILRPMQSVKVKIGEESRILNSEIRMDRLSPHLRRQSGHHGSMFLSSGRTARAFCSFCPKLCAPCNSVAKPNDNVADVAFRVAEM